MSNGSRAEAVVVGGRGHDAQTSGDVGTQEVGEGEVLTDIVFGSACSLVRGQQGEVLWVTGSV